MQTAMFNVRYVEMWRKMKILLIQHSEIHALLHEEFLPASVRRA